MNENKLWLEYEVDVRMTGFRTIKVKARNATEAVEKAELPLEPGGGIILHCEAEYIRKVKGE